MMERQARWSGLVMGVGSHMIAGARACSTLTTDYRPRPTIKTNRHYVEALPDHPTVATIRGNLGSVLGALQEEAPGEDPGRGF
jgi:hypothetical protein